MGVGELVVRSIPWLIWLAGELRLTVLLLVRADPWIKARVFVNSIGCPVSAAALLVAVSLLLLTGFRSGRVTFAQA